MVERPEGLGSGSHEPGRREFGSPEPGSYEPGSHEPGSYEPGSRHEPGAHEADFAHTPPSEPRKQNSQQSRAIAVGIGFGLVLAALGFFAGYHLTSSNSGHDGGALVATTEVADVQS